MNRFCDTDALPIKGITRKWTEHGSYVDFNKNGTVKKISFDWYEEADACYECYGAYIKDGFLKWNCDSEGHSALSSALYDARKVKR